MTLLGIAPRLAKRGNPFENPSIPLTDVALLDAYGFGGNGKTDTGIEVTPRTAMNFAAVFRAISLISGTIGSLPLKAYRYADRSEATPRSLSPNNNSPYTPFETQELWGLHLLGWGNSYSFKVRDNLGSIVYPMPLPPQRVQVKVDEETGEKVFIVSDAGGRNPQPFTRYEIMHIHNLSLDGVMGLSPIQCARQSIGIGLAGEKGAAKLFGSGTLMSGILSTELELNETQADALKRRWREKMAGLGHAYDIAVMDAGTKFQQVSINPTDAQFLESRTFQVEEIARWFGLPPSMLGEVSKHASQGGGNGIEAQNITFVRHTLDPWLVRIEQRLTREIVTMSTQYAEFTREGLLRGDTAGRYTAYATAIGSGWLTRNEARSYENLPPIEGLDEPLMPANTTTVSDPDAGSENTENDGGSDDTPAS